MNEIKRAYEISLWEEQEKYFSVYLKKVGILEKDDYEPGKYYYNASTGGSPIYVVSYDEYNEKRTYYIESEIPTNAIANISYFDESKKFVIGANGMELLSRCINPKLVTKTNGENTLTFSMYYKYIDNITGELEDNPFVPYLTNERKIKLRIGQGEEVEWYDFVIKQIQENSDNKTFTYTCKDRFINELSKTGFELEFDNELENNMGTVDYLARQILKGSDWEVGKCNNLKQFTEEPLYEVILSSSIKANDMLTNTEINLSKGTTIYIFYSHFYEETLPFQFLYTNSSFITNDNFVIDKEKHCNYIYNAGAIPYDKDRAVLSQYRGMRLVRQIQTKYDATIDKFVQVYTKDGQTYYGFTESKYVSPTMVNNYVVNPNAFVSTTGWYTEKDDNNLKPILELETDPPITADLLEKITTTTFTTFLKFPNNGTYLMNSSIAGFRSSLDEFVENQTKYVFRIKCKTNLEEEGYLGEQKDQDKIKACVSKYEIVNDQYILPDKKIFNFTPWTPNPNIFKNDKDKGEYCYFLATCGESISKSDLKKWDNRFGLFLKFDMAFDDIYIEDVQLFPYVLDKNKKLCVPGGESFEAETRTIYKYYLPNSSYSSIEDLVPVYEGESSCDDFLVQYNDGANAYTKIRSINAKESNRFNLLQDLNEKFECWMKIKIDREPSGKIRVVNGRQQKFISFVEKYGNYNHAGFRYGINSKSIQRTLDSNAFISKMIVKDNANEFAPNGFCSIARANDNFTKENYLFDFQYYWRQKILNEREVERDLYVNFNNGPGYYQTLRSINKDRDEKIDVQANLIIDISKNRAAYQTYKTSYDAAVEKRLQIEEDVLRLLVPENSDREKLTFEKAIKELSAPWQNDSKFIGYMTSWAQCKNVEVQHLSLYTEAYRQLTGNENRLKTIEYEISQIASRKRALNLQFYKKYSGYIQEGSWIKEDYVDDELYYIDALSTLHNSTQPKVTYQINVIDLSRQPGYEAYNFKLGDITFVEDTEFFGWSLVDKKNPYREEIIVNEITLELDFPEKDSIKVQNYKNQFEDLFQRITAQTQQAEYHTGEYERASKIVKPDGTISITTLENSFANNEFRLQNAKDQSVVMDEFGITTTSASNPNEIVRIVSGGIFMSTDGGLTWKTGITGSGMNSSYLTAGQINTDKIYIVSDSQPAFGWDSKGISAYYLNNGVYDLNRFVRFDRYGIYGIKDAQSAGELNSIDKVIEKAPFALTWRGFSLQNDDGSVKITSENDFQVLRGDNLEAVKIGRIRTVFDEYKGKEFKEGVEYYELVGENTYSKTSDVKMDSSKTYFTMRYIYGISIKDAQSRPVMETSDDGSLWLKDRLRIGTGNTENNNLAEIGYLEETRSDTGAHAVIKASGTTGHKFVVYEDGYIKATGGQIGNITIEQFQNAAYEVKITSDIGVAVKDGTQVTLTAILLLGGERYESETEEIIYNWYNGDTQVSPTDNDEPNQLTITVDFNDSGFTQYRCVVTVREKEA